MFVVTCKALNEICVRRVQYEWTCLATDLSCLISWHIFVDSSCPIVSWVSLTRKCLSENKQTSCCGCDINGCISKLCLDNIRFSMDYDVRTVVACWVQNYTWLTCVHTPPPLTKTGSTLHITVYVISGGHTTAALSPCLWYVELRVDGEAVRQMTLTDGGTAGPKAFCRFSEEHIDVCLLWF